MVGGTRRAERGLNDYVRSMIAAHSVEGYAHGAGLSFFDLALPPRGLCAQRTKLGMTGMLRVETLRTLAANLAVTAEVLALDFRRLA